MGLECFYSTLLNMSNKEQLASLLQVYKKGELKNENGSLINGLDVVAIQTHAIVDGEETRRLREIVEVILSDRDLLLEK